MNPVTGPADRMSPYAVCDHCLKMPSIELSTANNRRRCSCMQVTVRGTAGVEARIGLCPMSWKPKLRRSSQCKLENIVICPMRSATRGLRTTSDCLLHETGCMQSPVAAQALLWLSRILYPCISWNHRRSLDHGLLTTHEMRRRQW